MDRNIIIGEREISKLLKERGILEGGDAKLQFFEFIEKLGDLHNEDSDLTDAVGDIYARLMWINYLYGASKRIYRDSYSKNAPEHISDYSEKTAMFYAGEMSRGLQKDDVQKISVSTSFFVKYLEEYAESIGFYLDLCLNAAYNNIYCRRDVNGIYNSIKS